MISFLPIILKSWVLRMRIVRKHKELVGKKSLEAHIIGFNQLSIYSSLLICLLRRIHILRFGNITGFGNFLLFSHINIIGEVKRKFLSFRNVYNPIVDKIIVLVLRIFFFLSVNSYVFVYDNILLLNGGIFNVILSFNNVIERGKDFLPKIIVQFKNKSINKDVNIFLLR